MATLQERTAGAAVTLRPAGAAGGHADVPAELKALREWLARHMAVVAGASIGQIVLQGSSGPRLAISVPSACIAQGALLDVAARAYRERGRITQAVSSPEFGSAVAVAHPLVRQERLLGAVLLLFTAARCPGEPELLALDASAGLPAAPQPSTRAGVSPGVAPAASRWQAAVASRSNARDAAVALTLAVAADLDCERASLALCDARGRLQIVGSTDGWETEPSALAGEVAAAMAEAIESGETSRWPPAEGRRSTTVLAHRQLSFRRDGRSLCTVPWFVDGRAAGALLVERAPDKRFDAEEERLLEEASPALAAWFGLRWKLDRPWWHLMAERLREHRSARGAAADRLAMGAVAVALAVFLGWPIDSEITVPARLEGVVQRTLSAPSDAYLSRVNVRPGDAVRAGQVLLEFDAEDLRVERERLVAEAAGHDAAAGDAMAKQDLAALALRHSQLKEARARLALLDQRLERARITAPFDATVIQGDLSNAVGAPFKRGDKLLVLAPTDAYRAVVEIDADRIESLPGGTKGAMVLSALPSLSIPLQIGRVTPLAVVQTGRSFFEAEVELLPAAAADPAALRPGMQGIARFVGDRGPRGLVWLREASARVRFALWRWGA